MSLPRCVVPGATFLVSRRTVRRHHLLAPSPAITQLFLYTLAVCAQLFGIEVHAAVLMSTHEHLILTDTRGVLPEFLRTFHRLVALGVKVLHGWEGSVWDPGRPSVVELKTTAAIIEKTAYCIVNPVAAGLVRYSSQWPGLTTLVDELGRKVFRAERPDAFFDPHNPQWPDSVELALTIPGMVSQEMGAEGFRERVEAEMAKLEWEARTEMKQQGRGFLGPERCVRSSPYRRAKSFEPLRKRNPTFAVGRGDTEREAFLAAAEELHAFRVAYREALARWKQGHRDVLFPPGTWWMKRFHGVSTGPELATAA